jgi:dCTP deaminase
MAYLGTEKLKNLIKDEKVIEPMPSDDKIAVRVKSGAYELSLGDEVFRTDSKDRKKEILKNDKDQITINPGQFALLLTEERVKIPINKIAFISIKAGVKLRGLINVSGFHVDPGFYGNLVFSVYNAGSGPITLEKGEPYFLIWFAELLLEEHETTTYNGEHKNQAGIPAKYIDALLMAELASPNVLLEKINSNYKDLEAKAATNYRDLESKSTHRDYIFRTGLGIIIVIALKLLLDWGLQWGVYDKGHSDGYAKKEHEIQADSILNNILHKQKTLLIEIDSLKKERAKALLPTPKKGKGQ